MKRYRKISIVGIQIQGSFSGPRSWTLGWHVYKTMFQQHKMINKSSNKPLVVVVVVVIVVVVVVIDVAVVVVH